MSIFACILLLFHSSNPRKCFWPICLNLKCVRTPIELSLIQLSRNSNSTAVWIRPRQDVTYSWMACYSLEMVSGHQERLKPIRICEITRSGGHFDRFLMLRFSSFHKIGQTNAMPQLGTITTVLSLLCDECVVESGVLKSFWKHRKSKDEIFLERCYIQKCFPTPSGGRNIVSQSWWFKL